MQRASTSTRRQRFALCEEAEEVAASSGQELIQGSAKIAQWRTAFEALGELPRAEQRSLENRFERALKQCQIQVAGQRTRDQEQAWAHAFEAGRLIRAYGLSVAHGGAAAEREALKLAAEQYAAAVPVWPKPAVAALKQAWAHAESALAADITANEAALRMLCIRSEILTGRDSPTEDHALRREYQVKRLMQRMGQGGDQATDDLGSLALEWIRLGPVSAATTATLSTRFFQCRSLVSSSTAPGSA